MRPRAWLARRLPAAAAVLAVLSVLSIGPVSGAEIALAGGGQVARMGRMVDTADGGVRFAYPGVSLFVRFEGSALSVDASSTGDKSWLDVVVDGGPPRTIHLARERSSVRLAEGLAAGAHTVEVLHRSETWHGVVTLASFVTDGRMLAPPALPSRRLLFLGDSVTCGEALERTPPGPKQPVWWNPRASYGMLTARALDAQVQLVCHGGRGLLRSWNGRTDEFNLPRFYELAIADPAQASAWDQRGYAPDLIVSAIGTNDFNQGIPERSQYVDTYVAFVRTLLRDHPRARIVLTEGAILDGAKKAALTDYLQETIRRVNDPRLHYIPSHHYPGDAQDAHPTRAQHARMAEDLVPALRQLMSW
ncbi:lysophospholipase L1-like esterase [Pseudoduganella flava]|uniref:Lysophospholipase L1-like esterase n=1 Tax=Pseudoduganella flava TaxID=871742 RepID=A0A562PF04_9BURK|nr:bifunctional acetylxylan esterase/glucomannan deacetylase AxeC2 [Pseudoduganella flava]QGZ38858.1 xylan esterase [Pseudoduganella flava]TWI42923.1 lysophospholipase L1-like esterase [Pseudoduganella flava]